MSFILGFGSSEKDFERQELDFVDNYLKEKMKGNTIFENEVVTGLEEALKERKQHYDKLSEKYHDATEYPSRYSTYHYKIVNDYVDICVIFKFSHINRRHALSPDGWAMLQTKIVFHADMHDYRK